MSDRKATLDDIIAVFSAHVEKNYPAPSDFRSNFDTLLESKREKIRSASYAASLEKNIVFLSMLIDSAMALIECLLDPNREIGKDNLQALVEELEKKAHDATNERHKRAFVNCEDREFAPLVKLRAGGEASYIEKLEFDYKYLMTLRLFLFEFASVISAVREEYDLASSDPSAIEKIKSQLSLTANYYLGNIAVGETEGENDAGQK